MHRLSNRRSGTLLSLGTLCLFISGCTPEAAYRQNSVRLRKVEKTYLYETDKETKEVVENRFSKAQLDNLGEVMVALFGTPDVPNFPGAKDEDGNPLEVVDNERLKLAAGPVGRDENQVKHGLYREHCAHCHGISGDGAGPTAAFLNPYPRNYRPGWFKFKSTPGKNVAPTNDDLHTILREGIPGTSMPSFRLLIESERNALVDYVKYLSIRGDVERRLIDLMGEGEPGALLIDFEKRTSDPDSYNEQKAIIDEQVTEVVQQWAGANAAITTNEPYPEHWKTDEEARKTAIELGRELFFTSKGNCYTCHGDTGIGDGQLTDFDDWTKDVFPIDQKTMKPDPREVKEFVSLGAMHPRNIKPRNLRRGVYRGGRRPVDLFARIRNGIAGTPMPGNQKLSDEEIWALVEFVRSLPYEPLSQPLKRKVVNERKRAS